MAMIDVACFCGCCYSCEGEIGACPQCGEYVTAVPASAEAERQMHDELEPLLMRRVELADSRTASR